MINRDKAIDSCVEFIENEKLKSYDLFDALTNPFFDKISNGKHLLRRIFIQLNSKSPVDLHFLGMKKMVHTKTVSDLLWFYAISEKPNKTDAIAKYFHLLLKLKNKDGYGWGLNFPYATRFIDADIDMPNLYNTMNSAIAICYSYPFLSKPDQEIAKIALDGTFHFINNKLGFINEGEKGWYLYYPGQSYPTYNVNAFALYFLTYLKTLSIGNQDDIIDKATKIIRLLIDEQEVDGSWYYSRSSKGKWVDGFHSAFVIESLAFAYKNGVAIENSKKSLDAGIDFYFNNMFTPSGFPKYFLKSDKYPIEAQNLAQAIQTLSLMIKWLNRPYEANLKTCIDIALNDLYDPKGFFYYKKTKMFTFKQPYIRWSTSPMLLALEYSKKVI